MNILDIFLRHNNCELQYELSKVEVINRISHNLIEERSLFDNMIYSDSQNEIKTYLGNIYSDCFKMRRVITRANALLPIIYGSIESKGDKTIVKLKFRPKLIPSILIGIWTICFLLTGFIVVMTLFLEAQRITIAHILLFLILLAFTYLFSRFLVSNFKKECNYGVDFLEKILNNR